MHKLCTTDGQPCGLCAFRCSYILGSGGQVENFRQEDQDRLVRTVIEPMASNGLRTISIAYKDYILMVGCIQLFNVVVEFNCTNRIKKLLSCTFCPLELHKTPSQYAYEAAAIFVYKNSKALEAIACTTSTSWSPSCSLIAYFKWHNCIPLKLIHVPLTCTYNASDGGRSVGGHSACVYSESDRAKIRVPLLQESWF